MLWRCVVRASLMSGRLGFLDYSVILWLGYVSLDDYRYVRMVAFTGGAVRGRGVGLGLAAERGRRALREFGRATEPEAGDRQGCGAAPGRSGESRAELHGARRIARRTFGRAGNTALLFDRKCVLIGPWVRSSRRRWRRVAFGWLPRGRRGGRATTSTGAAGGAMPAGVAPTAEAVDSRP